MSQGTLFLVATPIGNLGDISKRAIETLCAVDCIAAEDTRHARPLLLHIGASTPCLPYHAHNEASQTPHLIKKLQEGQSIALISDAGTPLISDPGSLLVKAAIAAEINVCPIPGACAAITALSASGISSTSFRFLGFLPAKGEKRTTALKEACSDTATLILYESVHRIENLMEQLLATLAPTRLVCLARELTKRFEQIKTAPIAELYPWFSDNPYAKKGEYVVIVEGMPETKADNNDEILKTLRILLDVLPLKPAVNTAAALTGVRKNTVYELALQIKKESGG